MKSVLCSLLFLAYLAPASVHAETILGNLPPANDDTQFAQHSNLRKKAKSFTMPAGESTNIGNLTLRLRNYTTAGEVVAELRNDSGDPQIPGDTILLSFEVPPPGGEDIQDYILTPSDSYTLQAETTYWLIVYGIDGGSFDWMASDPGITPTGIASFLNAHFTTNGGSIWSSSSIINSFELKEWVNPNIFHDRFEETDPDPVE